MGEQQHNIHYLFEVYVLDEEPYVMVKSMYDHKSAALFALNSANRGIVVPHKKDDREIALPGHVIKYIKFRKGVR